MHEMWRCIAPLGHFIDVGRTDVLGGGKLGLERCCQGSWLVSRPSEVTAAMRVRQKGEFES